MVCEAWPVRCDCWRGDACCCGLGGLHFGARQETASPAGAGRCSAVSKTAPARDSGSTNIYALTAVAPGPNFRIYVRWLRGRWRG